MVQEASHVRKHAYGNFPGNFSAAQSLLAFVAACQSSVSRHLCTVPLRYFDFDELDEEEIGRPPMAAAVPSEGQATSMRRRSMSSVHKRLRREESDFRLFEGTVTLQIVAVPELQAVQKPTGCTATGVAGSTANRFLGGGGVGAVWGGDGWRRQEERHFADESTCLRPIYDPHHGRV